jgi:hypothetical protein
VKIILGLLTGFCGQDVKPYSFIQKTIMRLIRKINFYEHLYGFIINKIKWLIFMEVGMKIVWLDEID